MPGDNNWKFENCDRLSQTENGAQFTGQKELYKIEIAHGSFKICILRMRTLSPW